MKTEKIKGLICSFIYRGQTDTHTQIMQCECQCVRYQDKAMSVYRTYCTEQYSASVYNSLRPGSFSKIKYIALQWSSAGKNIVWCLV